MSIENQIERLIAALEANTGALIAFNGAKPATVSVVNAVTPAGIAANAESPAGAAVIAEKSGSGRGRRPTRYWKLADGSAVKSSAEDAPSAGAVEVTKDEYERLNHERATAAHAAQTTAQASEDPFGDAPAATSAPVPPTMDDVRTVALAYRDANGADKAKAIIKSVGGVDSLKDVPESKWAALIAAFKGEPFPAEEL